MQAAYRDGFAAAIGSMKGKFQMPKMKTHRGLKKRVKLTKNGKIKRAYASSQSKSKRQKRRLRKAAYAHASNAAVIKKLLPYN